MLESATMPPHHLLMRMGIHPRATARMNYEWLFCLFLIKNYHQQQQQFYFRFESNIGWTAAKNNNYQNVD